MNIKKSVFNFILLSGLTFSSSFAQNIPADTALRKGKLANGLSYYIRHNHIPKGRADFYIVQKVGSVLEEENQRGLAHFLEHMAFNGTRHFPGNTLITELGKKGIKFGSNINAYTSYDETVYNLTNIPVTRAGVLDTALLILKDWSGFILNKDEDIEEERGVVREEWRTRSSGYLRVQENKIMPLLFAGTPYADRLPIGTLNVINNFNPKELRDYYKQWYRPDLQGIIIVGDVNVDKVEATLKKLFADIPKPVSPVPRKYFKITDNKDPIIAIASDPEIRNTSAKAYWKQDMVTADQKETVQFFKVNLINNIISNMLNERFAEIAKKGNASYSLNAIMDKYSISKRPAWVLNVNAPDNDLKTALRIGLSECERMRRFGFNKNEFEPTIKNFNLVNNESEYYDRNNRENFLYTREYVEHFLNGGISSDPEWKYRTTRDILNNLSIDTLNFYAKKYVRDYNMAFEILSPQKSGLNVLSKIEVSKLWEEVKMLDLKPWIKEEKKSDLLGLSIPKGGKIIKTEKNTGPYGFTKWELSNGVKVWYKKTGYNESDLILYGFKPGGYALVSRADLPSAIAYNSITAASSGFEGIDGRSSAMSMVDKNFESLSATGSIMHMKVLFQHIYLRMTKFKKEEETFYNWKRGQKEMIKSRSLDPKTVYSDTLVSIMSNRHPRALSLNNMMVLNEVSYDKIIRLHREYFGNANGFNFILTGNADEDNVKVLVETWLGGLPSLKKRKKIVDHGMYPPKGVLKKHFTKKMETPQATVTIGYTGEMPYTVKNNILMMFVSEILKTVYLETIREKEGGSYGVAVSGELIKYPKERFIFQVNFDTNPEPMKKERLINLVYQEIKKLMTEGIEQDKVDRVKQNLIKKYLENISKPNARYWNGMQGAFLLYGIDWRTGYDKVVLSITPQMIKEFAENIFKQGNIIEVVMSPE
ncbi:insulinase family protein [Pedobacter sp. FW305-3-2-15-E-R2A2]|uniref:M16 family metallopeptidase n=1 Tax=Pedobacter sp. FW305-3-2-15-E-R2A2 TaxID=3140251 RepID=UPI003140652E